MSGEVNVVALTRGEERYVFLFDESTRTDLLRMLGRYAADPQLSFTWYDAAFLSQKIREMMPAAVMHGVAGSAKTATSTGRHTRQPMPVQDSPGGGTMRRPQSTPRFQFP